MIGMVGAFFVKQLVKQLDNREEDCGMRSVSEGMSKTLNAVHIGLT